jgi:hypothetical protein
MKSGKGHGMGYRRLRRPMGGITGITGISRTGPLRPITVRRRNLAGRKISFPACILYIYNYIMSI